MKYLLLFCAGFLITVFVHAQAPRFDHNNNTASLSTPLKLKVTLSKDSLFIIYKNQEIPGANMQILDSLLKKIPDLKNLLVEFEAMNAEPEKKRAVNTVLKQCQCHIIGHSINKQPPF